MTRMPGSFAVTFSSKELVRFETHSIFCPVLWDVDTGADREIAFANTTSRSGLKSGSLTRVSCVASSEITTEPEAGTRKAGGNALRFSYTSVSPAVYKKRKRSGCFRNSRYCGSQVVMM